MALKSFAALQLAPEVEPQDLVDTLDDYARSGAHISGDVVIGVVAKTQLTRGQLETLLASAETGEKVHKGMSERAGFKHLPPEVSAKVSILSAVRYGQDVQSEKKVAERKEADQFRVVAAYIRQLLVAVEA